MEKSNLVSVLQVLDKKELRELRKWVQSPAHNQREDVLQLFGYLTAGSHLFSEKLLAKERVFEAVFPGKTFNDAEMRQVMHLLFKVVEDFLMYRELLKDGARTQAMLARVYRERQLPKLFLKAMEDGKKIQQQQPFRNHHYYENEYLLQFEQYSYLSTQGRNVPLNLQAVSDANDVAFLVNKFQLSCIMHSHQAVYKTSYNIGLLEACLRHVEQNEEALLTPAVAMYYYSYRAINSPDDISFFIKMKEQITAHGELFPHQEMRVIYLLAINYCIGRINAGDASFYRETFELFKDGMEKQLFLEGGVLSRFTFSNAIIAGLNLREFDWVENFIQEYSRFLDDKHRDNYVGFYMARLYYEQKNYGQAMKRIVQSDYDDLLMNLAAKTMLLKMYYELDEFDVLDSLIESMGAYIQRKKVMGYHRTIYKNLILYTKKLARINPGNTEQVKKLKAEIEKAEPLMERKWLLEQVEKLI